MFGYCPLGVDIIEFSYRHYGAVVVEEVEVEVEVELDVEVDVEVEDEELVDVDVEVVLTKASSRILQVAV